MRPGPGHWELPHLTGHRQRRPQPPAGISHEGIDRQGRDIWRLSVYLDRNPDTRKRVEQRERVHGSLQDASRRREELLSAAEAERRRLAAGVRGRTMAELLDRYFPVWQRTPRKGHLPAASTIYGRHWLIETVIKPALGHRLPASLSAGTIAEWYDELMQHGYTSTKTELVRQVTGTCRRCGHRYETTMTGRRRTTRVACPTCTDTTILCRTAGEVEQPIIKQHRPMSASGIGDIHAVLNGAFRFAVQRDWLTATENPMPPVQRPTSRPNKRRPPSPEQVQRALAVAADHANQNLRPMLALLADTGARLGEACALRLSHFDTAACTVTIAEAESEVPKAFGGRHIKDTKTHNQRTIAIHPATLEIVLEHVAACQRLGAVAGAPVPADPFVFPAFEGRRRRINLAAPQSSDMMGKQVSDFFASLGMAATAKSLRSFMVTMWRQARVPDDVLRGRLGHEEGTPVTDRHYRYRQPAADRRETDALVGTLLYGTTGPEPPPSGPAPERIELAEVISLAARRRLRRAGG